MSIISKKPKKVSVIFVYGPTEFHYKANVGITYGDALNLLLDSSEGICDNKILLCKINKKYCNSDLITTGITRKLNIGKNCQNGFNINLTNLKTYLETKIISST